MKRLRRLGKALERFLYGSLVLEAWRFPAGALPTARQALGLEIGQAYDLAYPGSVGYLNHMADWISMDRPEQPLHTVVDTVAVFIATGVAVASRTAGSSRSMADLILFGPTPLSPYPWVSPTELDSIDENDRRHLDQAVYVLAAAARLVAGHDVTIDAYCRVTDALHEIHRWQNRM